jgi:hypothetical protein
MNNDSQNVRSTIMFEGENLLLMSHCVSGKYAVGVPHAPVLITLELLLRTCGGTSESLARRGQNQTLMNAGVRSIAYLHRDNQKKKCPALVSREEVNEEGLARFTHHPPPLLLNVGP